MNMIPDGAIAEAIPGLGMVEVQRFQRELVAGTRNG